MGADRQVLWERLKAESLEHFHSRRAAGRFLAFLKRECDYPGVLEAWLASLPSTDAKTVMSKRGQVDPTWFPARERLLNDAAALHRFLEGQPWHEAVRARYAELPKAKKSQAWKTAGRSLLRGRHQEVSFQCCILELLVARYRELCGKLPAYQTPDKDLARDGGGAAVSLLKRAMDWAFFPRSGPSTKSIVESLKSFRNAPVRRNDSKGKLLLVLAADALEAAEADFEAAEADFEASQSRTELALVRAARAELWPIMSKLRAEMIANTRQP